MRLGLFALDPLTLEHNYPTSNTRHSFSSPHSPPISDNPCRPRHYLANTEVHNKTSRKGRIKKKETPSMQSRRIKTLPGRASAPRP